MDIFVFFLQTFLKICVKKKNLMKNWTKFLGNVACLGEIITRDGMVYE